MFVSIRRQRFTALLTGVVLTAAALIVPAATLADTRPDTVVASLSDRTADNPGPTVSTPVVGFRTNTIVGDTVPVRLAWTGSDPDGVDYYNIHVSVDGEPYHTLKSGLHARSYLTYMRPGHYYRYRVRGVDELGNLGGWHYTAIQRVKIVDDTDLTTQYVGIWHSISRWWLLGGHARYSFQTDATVQVTFGGHAIAWVSRETDDGGLAVVLMDHHFVKTIDLKESPSRGRVIEFGRRFAVSGTHTIKIKVKGTGRVYHDAFIVLY
jgi:hypothetical protein